MQARSIVRALSRFYPLALLAVGVLAPGSARAAGLERLDNQCLEESAYSVVEACPAGPDKFAVNERRAAAFKSAPPPREAKEKQDKLGQKQASEEMSAGQRDLRTTRLQARARALLITEISGLERLYARTSRQSPDRAQLIRRLAEAYVELESAATRDAIKSDIDAQDAQKDKDKGKYDKAKAESSAAKKIVDKSRENAIKYYVRMKKDYPTYSKIDEILYYLAYEYEQKKDLTNARQVYLELIEKAPDSPYIPNAYLAFGELFFVEAMADPSKWALAEQAYKEVIKYKPPKNKVYGYAQYKLGYVYWNSGDYARAIQEFKDVIDYANQYEDMPNAKQIRTSARRDLIPVYAVAGKPAQAYNFFRPLSGDAQGSQDATLDMLRQLGLGYLDTGHYAEAIVLYQDLMARDKGDNFCKYQVYVTQAIQALKSNDKVAIRREMENMIGTYKRFLDQEHPGEVKLECANRTAELLAETAMSWHLEAVGSGGTRGTNDPKTMDLAAYLYQKVVDNFTQDEFAKFEFPRIVKEDWPNIYKIRYAMADLLYVQQRWEDCGPAFDAVVAENPKSAEAPEAAYAAVLCYQKMYDQLHKGDSDKLGKGLAPTRESQKGGNAKAEWEKFKPKDFTPMQQGMITAFNRYVCYIQPPAGDKKAEEQYVEVKYARARTYFEAQHWSEAAIAFRDIALNHSDKDAAIYASQLYLEALNVVGSKTEPPKPACFGEMAKDVPKFIDLYCKADKYAENKENCDLLTRVQCDIRRLAAEKTVELADSGSSPEGALETYKKGGDAYIALWRDYGEGPLERGEPSQCGKMDEVLYNAAQAYQAGRLLAKAIAVRRIMLNPKYNLQESELAKKSIYQIGGNYQAIAVYDQAAAFFMRYAEETKYRGEFADTAVQDAVLLNLGLGRDEEAIAASQAFSENFGRRKPRQAAQIAFAIASHYAEKDEWKEVAKRLSAALPLIDREATLDVKVQAHALLGRAYAKEKDGKANGEYGKVVATWKEPDKAAQSIMTIEGEDDSAKQRRLGRALTAVGEAIFYFAEKKREKVDAIEFPAYKGSGSMPEVKKHIETKVADWMKKKRPLIQEASEEYRKVVNLQPLPPPQWVIAAGSRVGQMWAQFVAEFRAAPIPSTIKKDAFLRTSYYGALDDASEPVKQQARSAYSLCLEYSVTHKYFDDFSRSCEKWLAENYKAEFHLIDEFKGDPDRVNSVVAERPYPLQLGGEPFVVAPVETAAATPKPEARATQDQGRATKKQGASR